MADKDILRYKDAFIKGDVFDSKARKCLISKTIAKIPRIAVEKQHYCTLVRNAFCCIVKPLVMNGMDNDLPKSIYGDKIRVYADKHRFVKVNKGSSKHNIQNYRHSGHAGAYIILPLKGLHY